MNIESDQLSVCNDGKIVTVMTEPIHSNGQKTTTTNNIPTTEMTLGSPALNGKATSSGTSTDKIQLALEAFNCKGFKQCAHYITQRLLACDVLCLTETWLRPHELHLIEEVIKHDKALSNYSWSVFTKSSMVDTPSDYCGRPFGGVAVICRNHEDFNYFSLETPSDRIITVSVLDHQGNSLQSIICT